MGEYRAGDVAFFISNSIMVQECKIVSRSGDFYTITYESKCDCFAPAVIRLRGSRLYKIKEEADQKISEHMKVVHKSNRGDY